MNMGAFFYLFSIYEKFISLSHLAFFRYSYCVNAT